MTKRKKATSAPSHPTHGGHLLGTPGQASTTRESAPTHSLETPSTPTAAPTPEAATPEAATPEAAPTLEAAIPATAPTPEAATPAVAPSTAAASTALALTAECLIAGASSLKESLASLLDEPQPITLDITSLQRIDTAALQVLTAFVRERAGHGRTVDWRGSAPALDTAAQLLGLTSLLGLPA